MSTWKKEPRSNAVPSIIGADMLSYYRGGVARLGVNRLQCASSAFCRAGGQALGAPGQVIMVANCSDRDYQELWLPWPWGLRDTLTEHGGLGQPYPYVSEGRARLVLGPHQVRVFSV